MPSIEISLSDDSQSLCDSSWNPRSSGTSSRSWNPRSSGTSSQSTLALHHEDKISKDIFFSGLSTSKSTDQSDYIDENGRCYQEIIEISDEMEDEQPEPIMQRTLSQERLTPLDVVGQFQWMIQHNFASRAMPPYMEARKPLPFAVTFVEHRI